MTTTADIARELLGRGWKSTECPTFGHLDADDYVMTFRCSWDEAMANVTIAIDADAGRIDITCDDGTATFSGSMLDHGMEMILEL